jgi:dienelactone hydrolase
VRYLLDHLDAVASRLAPALRGRLDARAVGGLGHSFGGYAVSALAARDGRVKALMVMAGGTDPGTAQRIRVPTLALAGGRDHLIPVSRVQAFEAAIPASIPHGLLVIADSGHTGFRCDTPAICEVLERSASALFLTYLAGLRDAAWPLDPARVDDARVKLTTVGMPPR